MPAEEVKVLSLNVWGIFHARHIGERMAHIAKVLPAYDIICLQEQFDEADFVTLTTETSRTHPHSMRFPAAYPVGSGLAIISRLPIVSSYFEQFRVQGKPENLQHGDYYANKGVALCVLRLPNDRGLLRVYNTHLIAQYERVSKLGSYEKECYAPWRLAQALQMARFIGHTSRPNERLIVCGDFNCSPRSPEMRAFRGCLQVSHNICLVPAFCDEEEHHTYSPVNAYNSKKGTRTYLSVFDMTEDIPAQLDHILFSVPPPVPSSLTSPIGFGNAETKKSPLTPSATNGWPEIAIVSCDVVFRSNVEVPHTKSPTGGTSVSDHWGVAAVFDVTLPCVKGREAAMRTREATESLNYAGEFLLRSAADLRRQAAKLLRGAAVLGLAVPLMFGLASRGIYAPMVFVFCGALCGFAACVLFILGQVHRPNDSICFETFGAEARARAKQ